MAPGDVCWRTYACRSVLPVLHAAVGVPALLQPAPRPPRRAPYRRRGLPATARGLVALAGDVAGASVLEIGGGIGTLELELLEAGAAPGTNVELSGGYEEAAAALLAEHRLGDRSSAASADFVEEAGLVEPHDVVVLHRVVCCYPDADALVRRPLSIRAGRLLLTYPRDRSLAPRRPRRQPLAAPDRLRLPHVRPPRRPDRRGRRRRGLSARVARAPAARSGRTPPSCAARLALGRQRVDAVRAAARDDDPLADRGRGRIAERGRKRRGNVIAPDAGSIASTLPAADE